MSAPSLFEMPNWQPDPEPTAIPPPDKTSRPTRKNKESPPIRYPVETILKARYMLSEKDDVTYIKRNVQISGRWEHLVKWAGYDDSFNSWEPIENLMPGCVDILTEFWQEQDVGTFNPEDLMDSIVEAPEEWIQFQKQRFANNNKIIITSDIDEEIGETQNPQEEAGSSSEEEDSEEEEEQDEDAMDCDSDRALTPTPTGLTIKRALHDQKKTTTPSGPSGLTIRIPAPTDRRRTASPSLSVSSELQAANDAMFRQDAYPSPMSMQTTESPAPPEFDFYL